jgi:UPF0716 family protein affecting phage T7 exclusion
MHAGNVVRTVGGLALKVIGFVSHLLTVTLFTPGSKDISVLETSSHSAIRFVLT